MENIKSLIKSKIHLIAFVILVIQPLMDVASYWLIETGYSNTPTTLLRLAVLAFTVLCGFVLTENKKSYIILTSVCVAFYIFHAISCIMAGGFSLISDVTNYIRVILAPFTALSFITFIKNGEKTFEWIKYAFVGVMLTILVIDALALITGTDPGVYGHVSVRGWFYNCNAHSAVLACIVPVFIAFFTRKKKYGPVTFVVATVLSVLSLFFFATRLSYLAIIDTALTIGVSMIILKKKFSFHSLILLVTAVVFVCLIPVSPMNSYRSEHNEIMVERQNTVNEQINHPSGDSHEPTEEEKYKALCDLYTSYFPDFVDRFGIEKTMEMYDYTTDINVLTNVRTQKLKFASGLMDTSPFVSKLFGLDYSRFTVGDNCYDVENDIHGIYYLYGIAGLVLYCIFILYFIFLIIKALVKDIKKYFTLDAASFGIAFANALVHAVFTAGVLRRPDSSVYMAVIMAVIYYLVELKKYDEKDDPVCF